MGNTHAWKIQMRQIHTWRNYIRKIPHNKILNKAITKESSNNPINLDGKIQVEACKHLIVRLFHDLIQ